MTRSIHRRIALSMGSIALLIASVPVLLTAFAIWQQHRNLDLISAIRRNDADVALSLLDHGADPNAHVGTPASSWRVLIDSLTGRHRSRGPSALVLALNWRPENGDRAYGLSRNTRIVQALLHHGATLGAPEIMARMAHTCAFCRSYRDSGSVTTVFSGANGFNEIKPFRTSFVRPDQFFFEYTGRDRTEQYVIWKNGEQTDSWWTITPVIQRGGSLSMAIAGATGVSGGSALTIPDLLMPGMMGARSLTELTDLRFKGSDVVDQARYDMLVGRDFLGNFTEVWIDVHSFLVRKIVKHYTINGSDVVTTTLYRPDVDVPILPSTFTFKPPKP